MIEPSNIKFRCSQLGKLMTNPRTKSETLSQTTKTYLTEIIGEKKYGIWEDISTKQMDKGVFVEADSLTMLSESMNKLLIKNDEHFKNDYITGTPDALIADVVIDVKSPYTWKNFALADLSKDYEWQLRGYMALTNRSKAILAYCLVDLPEHLLYDELRRQSYYKGVLDGTPEYDDLEKELRKFYTYDRIPANKRIRTFEIERDIEYESALYQRIMDCREYMESIWDEL